MEEDRSDWLYRAADQRPGHRCQPPLTPDVQGIRAIPDGDRGDVWRCGCRRDGRHWVIGLACDACETGGHGNPPAGMCTVGLAWRPVTARRARRLVRRAERRTR
jgi:hypothetical protein